MCKSSQQCTVESGIKLYVFMLKAHFRNPQGQTNLTDSHIRKIRCGSFWMERLKERNTSRISASRVGANGVPFNYSRQSLGDWSNAQNIRKPRSPQMWYNNLSYLRLLISRRTR